MAANNEIGTLEPVAEIGALCHERGVLFHTDAVQAIGAIPLDVEALHADMLSLSAHKFHGPKGIGALYIRKGVKIDPLIHGGAQERGHRAGTENLPGIVGLGKAIELAEEGLAENAARMTFLRNRLISGLTAAIPNMRINGTMDKRLPNNVNVSFAGIEGEAVLLRLDLEGNIPHRVHPPEHVYPEIIHIITIGRIVIIVTYPSSRREELVPTIPDLGRNIDTGIIPEGHPARAA